MKVLLVTYDLRHPGQNYTGFYSTLQKSKFWWHYLESTWLLATELSPRDWYNKLKTSMAENDNLLIIEVKRNYYGSLTEEAWNWIVEHLGTHTGEN